MRQLFAALTAAALCAPVSAFAATCQDPVLRADLLRMAEVDQAARRGTDWGHTEKVDGANTIRMRQIVGLHGWPGYALVGKDGADAAWLLVQHADKHVKFQQKCLVLMTEAVRQGQAEKKNLAYLVDRVAVNTHRPQIYGTQFISVADGPPKPQPIADVAHVEQRRKAVGLMPLAPYAAMLRRMAIKPSNPALGEALIAMAAENERALGLKHNDYASFTTTRERTTRFLAIVAATGWPDDKHVGVFGSEAAATLANTLPLGTSGFVACVRGLTAAHKAGGADGADVARLTDRWLNYQGKRQRYGTVMTYVDGMAYPAPIEDVGQVDELRAKLGLEPLAAEVEEMRRLNPVTGSK